MSQVRVARRYAKSLVQIAQEEGVFDRIHEDMEMIRATIDESRELELALKSPVINSSKKRHILEAIFGPQVSEITTKFIDILIRKGRESALFEISNQVHLLYDDINDIQIAQVTTPFEITEDSLRQKFIDIIKEVSGKQGVELHEKVDPELIGGYVIRIDDRQIDDSVRSRLNNLKQEMVG